MTTLINMKYWTATLSIVIIFCTACKKEEPIEPEQEQERQYLEDNIFGCDQFGHFL